MTSICYNPLYLFIMQTKLFTRCPGLMLTLLVSILFSSCIPQNKIILLQDKQSMGNELLGKERKYTLKEGDILYVRVMTTNQEMNALFNLDEMRGSVRTTTAAVGDPNMYIHGYSVNQKGTILLPVIGEVKVTGFTIDEVHALIQERTKEYLLDATLSIRLVNFKVTVLGEVNRPGTYNIYDNEFTVMDALGAAGDMTDYGNRKIHIIRKTDQGRHFVRLDITDREAVSSGFYYLQPNDVIYVEPMLAKRFALAQFPYAAFFTAISTAILLINFIN